MVIGVLASAIAAFFYVRVIVLMYFSEPAGDDGRRRADALDRLDHSAITVGVARHARARRRARPLLDLASTSSQFML